MNPNGKGPSRVEALFERVVVERGIKGLYHRIRGRRYRMKAEAVIDEIRLARALLTHPEDRIGLSGFDTAYRTYLAPSKDHRRLDVALRQMWRDVTNPAPRGTRLWHGLRELTDAFEAHSPDRPQVGILLTDGGDETRDMAEVAGLRSQQFMAAPGKRRHLEVIGVGRDQAVCYSELGRYARFGRLTMLDGVSGLRDVVHRTLYRVVAHITGVTTETEPGRISLSTLMATLSVEREGIDLVFAVDISNSMAAFEVTLPEPVEA